MIKITFPDGSVREYEQGVTGLQIAESISPALARNVVSCGVNGETVELNRPINEDANVELYKFEDEQGKHTFWHTSGSSGALPRHPVRFRSSRREWFLLRRDASRGSGDLRE